MTNPGQMPNLLEPNEFNKFKDKDEAYFLSAAGETIREYCGWHIYPVMSFTDVPCEIGRAGIVMLESLNVMSVENVSLQGTALAVEDYEVHPSGWLQISRSCGSIRGYSGSLQNRWLLVDFTHGLPDLPKVVAEVAYELTARTLEKPAGVAKSMSAGPNAFTFNEFGAVLSDDQKNRLAPYVLTRV